MGKARYDQNLVPTLIGVASNDGSTPIEVWLDAIYHSLLVSLKNGALIKFAPIDFATNIDNTVVAAVPGAKIKVLSMLINNSGASDVVIQWKNGSTPLDGAITLKSGAGYVLPASSPGQGHYLETGINTALVLNLSSAVQVSGHLSYYEET